MLTLLIAALFLASATCATGIIALTLRAQWPAVARVRSALSASPEWQEVRVTILDIKVEASGQVLHGDFMRRAKAPARALRVAA